MEQDEIINTFLETIEANDILKEMKTRCSKCNCNYDHPSIALKQSKLPEHVVEQIKSLSGRYCIWTKLLPCMRRLHVRNRNRKFRRKNTQD